MASRRFANVLLLLHQILALLFVSSRSTQILIAKLILDVPIRSLPTLSGYNNYCLDRAIPSRNREKTMVTLQRRCSSSTTHSAGGISIGFGMDADISHRSSSSSTRARAASSVWVHDAPSLYRGGRRSNGSTYSLSSSSSSLPWFAGSDQSGRGYESSSSSSTPFKYLATLALLSWVASLRLLMESSAVLTDLRQRERRHRQTLLESQKSLKVLKAEVQYEKRYAKNLDRTVETLDREVRIVSELEDAHINATGGVLELPPDDEELLQVWLEHRLDGLQSREGQLQSYLQEFSRIEAIQRYVVAHSAVELPPARAASTRHLMNHLFNTHLAPLFPC